MLRPSFVFAPDTGIESGAEFQGEGVDIPNAPLDSGDDFGAGIPDAPEPLATQTVQHGQSGVGVPTTPAAWSLREYAKNNGIPSLSGLESDEAAAQQILGKLQSLYQQNQQFQPLVQQYQAIVPRWSEFQKWEAQQAQAAKQAAAPAAKPKWESPEFDQRWLSMVERDANGRLVAVPGADPTLPQKINKYNEFVKEKQAAFLKDPAGFIEPLLEDSIQKRIDAKLNSYKQEVEARASLGSFIQDNSDWLYQRDQGGNVVRDPSGRPIYSEYGAQLQNNVNSVTQLFNANRAGKMPDHELIKQIGLAITTAGAQRQAQAPPAIDPRQAATGVKPNAPQTRRTQPANSLTGMLQGANGAGLDSPDLKSSLRAAFAASGLINESDNDDSF